MTAASPLIRRLAALGLLAIAIGGAWTLVLVPIQQTFGDFDRAIAEDRELLLSYLERANDKPELEAKRDGLMKQRSSKSRFLKGASVELVSAGLQDQVKQVIDRHGGILKSTQTLPAEDESGFLKVSLRVGMTASTPAMQRIFHTLETAAPVLFLEGIEIRAASLRGRRSSAPDADSLKIRFDLVGYMRGQDL